MDIRAIRVLLVDDQAAFRKGMADLLDAEHDLDLVGEAEDGVQALERARALVPDVVLMDLSMPRMGGLEATRRIKAEMPCVRIVMLTAHDAGQSFFDAVRNGAHAYVLKSAGPAAILRALREAARGEPSITPSVAARLLEDFAAVSPAAPPPHLAEPGLAPREHEALRLIADGTRSGAVAEAVGIAEGTLGNLLQNMFEKLYLEHRQRSAGSTLPAGASRGRPGGRPAAGSPGTVTVPVTRSSR